ncbi:acyl-CoA dehydrogenase, partial [Flavobacteriaceae bacterium]|nr:acyl-CoA dehydrogenase [Flavobacteriaceae bacterium]
SQLVQIAMTKAYLYEASDIIAKKGKEVIINMCKEDEQKQLLEVLYKKLQFKEYSDIIGLKTQIADKLIEKNKYCF